ncbi:MAG TPA: hypothetical protein VL221_12315 [Bacteroidota bacterium]|nr:hypothetical protein [Bacteroidota bacterium]
MNRIFVCAMLYLLTGATQATAGESDLRTLLKSLPGTIVSGYDSAIGGGTILYHSANPHARMALIARATGGEEYAEWLTSPVPSRAGERVVFAWLAGVSGSKGEHAFALDVNGREMVRFVTPPDTSHATIVDSGSEGSTLTFCATGTDRYGDLFGYMFLSLKCDPRLSGSPLRIRVTGRNDGSQAWVMIFEHPLVERAWISPCPALRKGSAGPVRPTTVEIEHYGPPVACRIAMEGGTGSAGRAAWGLTPFTAGSRPVAWPVTRRITVRAGSTLLADTVLVLLPVHDLTFYLLPHSHTDIGYSAYQPVVENNHMRYIDSGIAIGRRTASYPPGERFKWNIEVMWPLESYCRSASPGTLARLAAAIDSGWIGLNGLYANVLTGLCTPEEFYHLTDFARATGARFSRPLRAAMISDIPAYSSAIVTGLARAGIRYFSSGPNYVPTMPDGGDRIGGALKAWGDRPFYWISSSGADTVLFWMAGHGYSWFHALNMGELSKAAPSEIFDYVAELDAKEYPYDMVQVRYTIGGDNGPPDPNLCDFIRKWNREYLSPRFAIATTEELFERFERKYGATLPLITGDLTPYWEDGAASTARELAGNRRVAEELTQTEALYALLAPGRFPAESARAAWRNVVLFDEHTWGASNSISDPDNTDVKAQWEYKRSYLDSARAEEVKLRRAVLPPGTAGTVRTVDVINTCSWQRTDLVVLPDSVHTPGLRAHDAAGRPVPAQALASGETAFLAVDVPPFGCARITFEAGRAYVPAAPAVAGGTHAGNETVEVAVNPRTGVISRLESGGRNFADTSGGGGLNQYLYVAGRDPRDAAADSGVTVSVGEAGPLVASLRVASRPPGGGLLVRTIRVIAGIDRADIVDSLWKDAVRSKESVHIAFPFLVPGGQTRIDNTFSILRPDSDQLPGSCRDFFCAERWVDVANGTEGVLTALPDAPLVETGRMTDERQVNDGVRSWRTRAEAGSRIYSYVMNNYWHTNYKADQEGLAVFRYSLMPHGPFDAVQAERFGVEIAQPMIPVLSPTGLTPGASLLGVEPPAVLATGFAPAADGGWILHLYNAGAGSAGARLTWNGRQPAAFSLCRTLDDPGIPCSFPVAIPACGTAFFRIR